MSDSLRPPGLFPLSMEFFKRGSWSGSHSLLQGIFLTQGLNWGLLHCKQFLPSEPPGKPVLLPVTQSPMPSSPWPPLVCLLSLRSAYFGHFFISGITQNVGFLSGFFCDLSTLYHALVLWSLNETPRCGPSTDYLSVPTCWAFALLPCLDYCAYAAAVNV